MSTQFLTSAPSARNVRRAVLAALSLVHWRRASEIARATRLPVACVRRCLHGLSREMLAVGCTETHDAPFVLTPAGRLAQRGTVHRSRKRKESRHD